uniref:Uncharacterized protein n=1 Tax=Panagrellus redivivus TaxID=6233 RepID=A0A7E4VY26_PANRE
MASLETNVVTTPTAASGFNRPSVESRICKQGQFAAGTKFTPICLGGQCGFTPKFGLEDQLDLNLGAPEFLGPGSGAKIRVLGPGSGAEAPKLWLRLRYFKMAPSGLRRSQLWGPWLSKQSWTKPGSATLQTRPLVLLSPEKFTELSWKSLKNLSPKDAFSGC